MHFIASVDEVRIGCWFPHGPLHYTTVIAVPQSCGHLWEEMKQLLKTLWLLIRTEQVRRDGMKLMSKGQQKTQQNSFRRERVGVLQQLKGL